MPLNYLEEQQYKSALKQLQLMQSTRDYQYYQNIKDIYEYRMREEKVRQETAALEMYVSEVVHPLIKQVDEARESYLQVKEQGEKSRLEHPDKVRDLKNAMKQALYNKRMRQIERVEERNRQIENHFYGIKENPDDKVTIVLSRALPPELEEKE